MPVLARSPQMTYFLMSTNKPDNSSYRLNFIYKKMGVVFLELRLENRAAGRDPFFSSCIICPYSCYFSHGIFVPFFDVISLNYEIIHFDYWQFPTTKIPVFM